MPTTPVSLSLQRSMAGRAGSGPAGGPSGGGGGPAGQGPIPTNKARIPEHLGAGGPQRGGPGGASNLRNKSGQIVESHEECPKCGYDLIGLDLAGECPECGKKIRSGLLSEDTSRVPWIMQVFEGKPTAALMELSLRDMIRVKQGTLACALGMTTVLAGVLGLFGCLMASLADEVSAGSPIAAMLVSAVGGLVWMWGVALLLWPRSDALEPRHSYKSVGSIGATSFAAKRSRFSAEMRWIGEWWPMPLRLGTMAVQGLLPLAALASGATFATYGFGPQAAVPTPSEFVAGLRLFWMVALCAPVPALLLMLDLSRSANDDVALGKLRFALAGVPVAAAFFLGVLALRGALGVFGVLFVPITLLAYVAMPIAAYQLATGLWSLRASARWAPKNKVEERERSERQLARDVERGRREAQRTWEKGW